MKFGEIPHLGKPMPRIVVGTDFLMGQAPATSFASYDAYWEAGGRAFDTAHCYGANSCIFEAWVTSRGVRKEVIYYDKGCHPYGRKRVTREDMLSDIQVNHERLRVDFTDFFVLHRDDEDVPVGEIIDWLNEFKDQGLIGVFGGSNWTHHRIIAANEYAAAHGKQGMSVNNPTLSLAKQNVPIWDGCISLDDDGRKWHAETEFPLCVWSSMARGYFAYVDDKDVIRAYDDAANQARRARAEEYGKKHGLSAPQVALIWTLNVPGNVFALCGLRTKDNAVQTLEALEFEMSAEDHRWLEHGE